MRYWFGRDEPPLPPEPPRPSVAQFAEWGRLELAPKERQMDVVHGLDLSFDAPLVTPEWAAARIAEGALLLVANGWTGAQAIPGTEQALRIWREAGGWTALYFCVHDRMLPQAHFRQARVSAGDEWAHLAFVAVDVEVAPVTTATVRAACDLVAAAGQHPIVYTGWGEWSELTANSGDCADLPLWDASYGQTPGLEMRPVYGQWQRRVGHQYQGTTTIDRLQVDLSLFDGEWLKGVQTMDKTRAGNAAGILWGHKNEAQVIASQLRATASQMLAYADTLDKGAAEDEQAIVAFKVLTGLQDDPNPAPTEAGA